jgi:hypothetical protein
LKASAADTDQDGMTDAWEMEHFGTLSRNGGGDFDGDGLTDIQESFRGTDPTQRDIDQDILTDFVDPHPYDYYNNEAPTLAIIGGNNQTAPPGTFNPQALDVAVWSAGGTEPLANAPVTFDVAQGGGLLTPASTGNPTKTSVLERRTDTDGTAQAHYQQPDAPGVVSQITATAGTAQVTFISSSEGAAPNNPPMVSVNSPANGAIYAAGSTISFTASANDPEDGNLSASIEWNSSLSGSLGSGGSFTSSTLATGTHLVTASVTDSGGRSASASVSVTVQPAATNTAPVVTITEPADESTFAQGIAVSFVATATDAEDGNLTSAITWSSSRDGALGTGGSVTTNSLSVGSHVVTASATDSSGLIGQRSVTIAVEAQPTNTPPGITINAPADGAGYTIDDLIGFVATATDAEDEPTALAAAIQWQSDRDGYLGSSGSISSRLSEGMHQVTAAVSDSGGLTASATVNITVGAGSRLVTAGLVLHLDAEEGVTSLGGVITGWADLSGRDNDMSGSGVLRPPLAVTPAGRAAVRLDGIDDAFAREHAANPLNGFPAGNADRTVFVALRYHSSSATAGVVYGAAASNQTFGLAAEYPTGKLTVQGYGDDNDLISAESAVGSGWLVQAARLRDGQVTLFRDGIVIGSDARVYATTLSKIVIGSAIDGAGHVGMDLAAALLYNRALSDSECARVEAYLHARLFDHVDSDGDGLPDSWEEAHFGDLDQGRDGDWDSDGLTNLAEYQLGLDPRERDSDGDGMPDGWEVAHALNPFVRDGDADPDEDGMGNLTEYRLGRNPRAGVLPGGGASLNLRVYQPTN